MNDKQTPPGEWPREWPRELGLDENAGPAAYITRAKADSIIFAALDQAGFPEFDASPFHTGAVPALDTQVKEPPRAQSPRRMQRGFGYVAAAAMLAFVGVGSASAAVMWYLGIGSITIIAPRNQPQPASSERAHHTPRKPKPQVESEPVAPSVLPEFVVEAPPASPKPERRAPEDLLEEGNRLRAERRWAKADEAYERAFQSAPRSQTAYVARVASAAVRLEHLHDAAGALSLYRAALRQEPKGALGEEILLGIAEAQRALGDRAAERRALERFMADYPSSPHTAQVRARLD